MQYAFGCTHALSLTPRNNYTFKVHVRLCLEPQVTDWQRYFHLNCIFRITRGAEFGLLTHPGLLLQEESARPEDFTTTCHLRFQQTEVEVYAHFRVPDDNRNQFLVHKKVNFNFHCNHFMEERKCALFAFSTSVLCMICGDVLILINSLIFAQLRLIYA